MSQHIVRKVVACRFFPDADLNPHKLIFSKMLNNILQTVMTTRAAFFAHPDDARLQADIVVNYDQVRAAVYLIIIQHFPDTFAAQVHISQRLYQNYFLPV